MDEIMTTYHITVWTWNGNEYDPLIVYEGEDLEETKRRYDSMSTDIDHPLIQLWEITEDEINLVDYKES